MTSYRRLRVPSASYFFTVNLAQRRTNLLVERIEGVRGALRYVLQRHPFQVEAMVILPDHLHAVWTLPARDADYPLRWRLFKTWFSRRVAPVERVRDSRATKGERGIWQRRYWEHLIRDDLDLQRHVDYIHFNPVKHGLVAHAREWPHSTFHRYVAEGRLQDDWGVSANFADEAFGEAN